jgi:hypothetical protein
VLDAEGKTVISSNSVAVDGELIIHLAEGKIRVKVTEVLE